METLNQLVDLVVQTLTQMDGLRNNSITFVRRDAALLMCGLLMALAIGGVVIQRIRRSTPGVSAVVLPALLVRQFGPKNKFLPLRYLAYAPFLAGLVCFGLAIADPHSALVEEEESYPGHRIAMMIDASLSMNTAFATEQLAAGNTFLANVAAAEYFVKRRMDSRYQDLVSLVQFGNEAYIVTPFTNDYENILLSISLVGTPEEYKRFPDHGTLIMKAISRGVQLFRTFDFLGASGNLIVIFSDGQDTHARFDDVTLDDIMQDAADSNIPVYFIRTAYDQSLGDIITDQQWKLAVERTGGKFFPAGNESAILAAIHEIDDLAKGQIRVKHYVAHEPRFAGYALSAVLLWTMALGFTLSTKHFRRFP